MDKCESEISLSDLLLDETPLLDREDVHYVHLPNSKNKKIYRHNHLQVKIDGEFLETITNDVVIDDFNVFESGNYERLTGVIECSRKASIDEERTVDDVFGASSQTLKNDLEGLSACFSPLPDLVSEWEIEGPLIPDLISNISLPVYANIEALFEHYETGFEGEREETFDLKSFELQESFCAYPIVSPKSIKSLENVVKENCDVFLEIQHERIQVCDSLNDTQISFSQMIKLKLRIPACIDDEGEVQDSSLEIVYAGDRLPISYSDISEDVASVWSLELDKLTPELTDNMSDSGEAITDMDIDDTEPSRDPLPDCRLMEKDTFNYTNAPRNDVIDNSPVIKLGFNFLIDPENVKDESSLGKGFENVANQQESSNPKINDDSTFKEMAIKSEDVYEKLRKYREFEARKSFAQLVRERFGGNENNNCKKLEASSDTSNVKKLKKDDILNPSEHDGKNQLGLRTNDSENILYKQEKCPTEIKKDSKIATNSTSFTEMPIKSEEVYEKLRKYREFEAKKPFAQVVRERFGWDNNNCRVLKTPAVNLKVEELKKDGISRNSEIDGKSKLRPSNSENLNRDSKARRNSNEVEIKATKLKGERKNTFIEDFSSERENVLAKFNDWVIDIDWVDEEEAEGTVTPMVVTPSVSDSSQSFHSQSLQTNVVEREQDQAQEMTSSEGFQLRNWVFKKDYLAGTSGHQAPLTKLEAFMKLRQGVIPNLQLARSLNSKLPSKKQKVNNDEEKSFKQTSHLQTSLSPPRNASEPTPPVHFETKRANKLPDCNPVKIIGSSETSKEAELISLLELRYNLRIVVRECAKEVPTRNDEMFCVPDFIVDEKSAVIFFPLRNLNISPQFFKLKKKIYALSLRHSILYVLLVDKTNKDPCVHPDVLKMYSKLSGFTSHLNMVVKDYIIKLLICKDLEEAARYLRRIVDFSLLNDASQRCEAFQKREWLLPTQSQHETFLSSFPTLSSFHAQMMLATAPLRSLMKMSKEELTNAFPIIPEKCLMGFHKLAHVKLVLKPEEHNILNVDDVESQNLTLVTPSVPDDDPKANPKRCFKFKKLANMNCSNRIDLSNHVSPQPAHQNFQASSQVFNTYVTNNFSSFAGIKQDAFAPANIELNGPQSPVHFRQRNETNADRFSSLSANEGWIQNYSAVNFNRFAEPTSIPAQTARANPQPRPPPMPLSWQRYNSGFKQ